MSEAVPVEVSVTGCDAPVFTGTLPNARLVVLTANVAVPSNPCRRAPSANSNAELHIKKSASAVAQIPLARPARTTCSAECGARWKKRMVDVPKRTMNFLRKKQRVILRNMQIIAFVIVFAHPSPLTRVPLAARREFLLVEKEVSYLFGGAA
jgi:hypothetical protein